MKYVHAHTLLLTFVFYTSCMGQNRTNPTSYGPYDLVRNIIQDRKGNILMATYDGVFQYNGKSFTKFTEGVSSARFFSLLEDRQGNLWFGSLGSGVYRYDGKSFQNLTTDNGLLNNEITCIYEDKAGNIWLGAGGGASRYDGKTFRNYIIKGDSMMEDRTGKTLPNSPRQPYEVKSIIEDKTGKFWLSTGGNTFVYDGENFTVVARDGKRPFKNVLTIIEDKKGNIWLGGDDGLWRYDGSTFTDITYNEYFGKSDHLFREGQYLPVSVMICTGPVVLKFDGIKVLDFFRVRS